MGRYTWTARLRFGTVVYEFPPGSDRQQSIDVLKGFDVASLLLASIDEKELGIRLDIAPGESWGKKWIREFNVLTNEEMQVVDCVWLKSSKSVYHYIRDGMMVITSNEEPPHGAFI